MKTIGWAILAIALIAVAIAIVTKAESFAPMVTLVIGGVCGLAIERAEKWLFLGATFIAALMIFIIGGLSPAPFLTIINSLIGVAIGWLVRKLA